MSAEGASRAGRKAKSMVEVSARAEGCWVVWKDCIKGMVRVLEGTGVVGRWVVVRVRCLRGEGGVVS